MKVNRWLFLSIGLLLVLFISGAVISGINAQNNNTIYGCYKQNNGQLRVVSGSGQCNPSENEISWSSNNNESTFEDHHQSLVLTAPVNQTVNFPVPKTDTPVRFDISVSQINLTAYDTRPEPPPHNVPVTLMQGTMYYDSTVNQFYLLPATDSTNFLNGNPSYEYSLRTPDVAAGNTAYMLRVMHQPSGASIDFAHPIYNVNNLTMTASVDTNIFNVETPLVTYKINMWY